MYVSEQVAGSYWQHDYPEPCLNDIIGPTPKRWGRMDQSSRIAIVEIGFLLGKAELLNDEKCLPPEINAGLIVGTRRGSLFTDMAFCRGIEEDSETASPLLFSYTLPNIPLAEAASQYKITGPVFALYSDDPLNAAIDAGRLWIQQDGSISFIIVGELDCIANNSNQNQAEISAKFKIIR